MAIDVIGAHYTTVFNQAVRDCRMSRRARGLLVELLSHRDGFGISLTMLLRNGPEGKDALSAALRELEQHGYLRRERERDARGRLGEARYYLTDMPEGLEIVAQAPWPRFPEDSERPDGDDAPLGARRRRSAPEPENPPLDESGQTPRSEPKADFPAQAEPAQGNPPPKKTTFKKTSQQNTNPLPPSASRPHAREASAHAAAVARGEQALLSIGRHHPELHAALATGNTLADQAPLVGRLLESGVSREHIREALVGRPYPAPHERTHSLAALVSGRLKQLAHLAAADRSREQAPAPGPPVATGPPTDGTKVGTVAIRHECPGQDGLCGRPVGAPGELCPICTRLPADPQTP
ncbi:hypothetical protein G3I40_12175 [Streptomyces sp. SID14478]|uniref:hypothetical protein n=1 Tax=Streptomyces sp. SID14478 TaxID=2706073 RepID=UPI0013D9DD5F|nr:hypothetical protein [Streptomyces sp. SID14478]NEB75972.1 hypothetical protein [Streptomyces sp. SID14478]